MTHLPALAVEGLQVRVQSTGLNLLQSLSFELHAGQRLTLMGESGSGKSILAQAIMGTLPAGLQASGQVRIQGVPTDGRRELTRALWGREVAMLPQEPWLSLNPLMRVLPQVAEAAHYRPGTRLPWRQARAQAHQRLGGLGVAHAARQWVHQISGGMAQRVALATTQLSEARLLIADEPTKGLDAELRDQVAELLLARQNEGQALLTITHDIVLAEKLGGMLAVMREGKVVEFGTASDVLRAPQHAYTRELLAAQPARWPSMLGTFDASQPRVIEGCGLGKAYGTRSLFENQNISLHRGEVVAIVGPSGCGKTTLGNMLLGLVPPDKGQVRRATDSNRLQYQKLYQDPPAAFAPQSSLNTALQDLVALHGLDASAVFPLLQKLKLSKALLARKPAEISGGELQRFALLRLLLLRPRFIFADEPTSRLDPITQRETIQVLCHAAAEFECAVLLVTHDAEVAAKASHRQLALSGGQRGLGAGGHRVSGHLCPGAA
ncbi:ABC transporter ATP-binding protein [Polaromonas aquatica]|uniref:ABC transporter ATP-binding protein n=1 Tax=Polaromonas aquatica TaxID=332657 RepID=UPI003D64E8CF